ncbi:hypothetical protein ACFO9Q_00185 [Paenibacillus sp. GCM10023252]|uniref:hypothetical protein n=1 Tax=Paenibacillus sp. GCM10023252 TaxID=3252649 RepID=UPI003606EF47
MSSVQGLSSDQQITQLSASIQLKDYLSEDGRAVGAVRLRLHESGIEARENRNGYFYYCDLEPGVYSVVVEAEYYKKQTVTLTIEDEPEKFSQLRIILQPNALYPYPENVTLLRGVVKNHSKEAVAGAAVWAGIPPSHAERLVHSMVGAMTDTHGEFVVPLAYVNHDLRQVQLEVAAAGYRTKRLVVEIAEGSTVSRGTISLSSIL